MEQEGAGAAEEVQGVALGEVAEGVTEVASEEVVVEVASGVVEAEVSGVVAAVVAVVDSKCTDLTERTLICWLTYAILMQVSQSIVASQHWPSSMG